LQTKVKTSFRGLLHHLARKPLIPQLTGTERSTTQLYNN